MSATILYIDDDALNRVMVRKMLKPYGYRVFEEGDAQNGLYTAQRERPDLILMDYHLPGMDSGLVLSLLKSSPLTAKIPVVVLTADTRVPVDKILNYYKCESLLFKPFSIQTLIKTVVQIVEKHATV
jgi:CheY-like chemotaxis protein